MISAEMVFRGERSKKLLESSSAITRYQKEYHEKVKVRAAQGEPVIWFNVGVPQEIFHALDLPCLCNPNWSAIIAAKQMAAHYLDVVNARGFFRDLCRYCSVPLGYFFDHKPESAPWGGVPKPSALVVDTCDDPVIRIWELMAQELDVPLYIWDHTMIEEPPRPDFWNSTKSIEEYSYRDAWRVDYAVKETEGLISFLETVTGRSLSEAKLREVMARSNEQFEYVGKAMELAAMVPTPMGPGDHMASAISTQFFRGHELGLAHAKMLFEELQQRTEKRQAACAKERTRLMYLWVPNWFSPGFFNYFEQRYGAIFVWMAYLPVVPKQLIRTDLRNPLKALASRYVHYTEFAYPPIFPEIAKSEAKRFKINGVIYAVAESCKLLCGPLRLTVRALEDIGIPTLEIRDDMVDVRDWDDQRMKAQVSSFIETLA